MVDLNLPVGNGRRLRSSPIPRTSVVESIVLRAAGIGVLITVATFVDLSARVRVSIVALCSADLAVSFLWRYLWQRHSRFPFVVVSAFEGMVAATAIAYIEPSWNVVALFGYLMSVVYLGALTGRVAAFAGGAAAFVLALVREVTLPADERIGAVTVAMFGFSMAMLIAYTNARSFAQARTSESLERLHQALRTVTSQPELDATLTSIAAAARSAIRAEQVMIQLREEDHLVVAAGGWTDTRWSREQIEKLTRWELASVDRTPIARTVNLGETVVVPDLANDARFPEWVTAFGKRVQFQNMRSLVTVPLRVNEQVMGAFSAFFRHPDLADTETVRLLQTYAEHVTLMIVRAQAYDRERQLTARLREADRVKSEFVALASHQLRTPLTATKGFIDTVLLQWDRLDDGTRQNMLQRAAVSADELGRMLSQLLDLSRIESEDVDLDIAPCAPALLVDDVVASLTPVLRHEIVIDIPAGILVMADRDALCHVLDNLLANALKFSPPGTRVTVTAARDGNEVIVEVTDQGPGIALDEQERVFDRFYRGSPSRGSGGGTGLGLSIARRFVEALGGRIWVESEPGAGATFVLALPAAPRSEGAGVEVNAKDHAITP